MGVSLIGQSQRVAAVRHALATAMVFLGLWGYLYGPPSAERMAAAAHDRCNALTGSKYRAYRLEWRTTTYQSVAVPHWVCHDLTRPGKPGVALGWWVTP